jgi:membrane associated rhomboid family serine protease
MDRKPLTMTVGLYDTIWMLAMLGFWVVLGIDASGLWFGLFGCVLVFWFREPLGDWLADRIVNKMHREVHAND